MTQGDDRLMSIDQLQLTPTAIGERYKTYLAEGYPTKDIKVKIANDFCISTNRVKKMVAEYRKRVDYEIPVVTMYVDMATYTESECKEFADFYNARIEQGYSEDEIKHILKDHGHELSKTEFAHLYKSAQRRCLLKRPSFDDSIDVNVFADAYAYYTACGYVQSEVARIVQAIMSIQLHTNYVYFVKLAQRMNLIPKMTKEEWLESSTRNIMLIREGKHLGGSDHLVPVSQFVKSVVVDKHIKFPFIVTQSEYIQSFAHTRFNREFIMKITDQLKGSNFTFDPIYTNGDEWDIFFGDPDRVSVATGTDEKSQREELIYKLIDKLPTGHYSKTELADITSYLGTKNITDLQTFDANPVEEFQQLIDTVLSTISQEVVETKNVDILHEELPEVKPVAQKSTQPQPKEGLWDKFKKFLRG